MVASTSPLLEIAVQDPQGASTALARGADRLELCVGLESTGGLTPSLGLVQAVAAVVSDAAKDGRSAGLNVLIRPCEGGFVYEQHLLEVMRRDIVAVGAVPGVTGVVLGALTETRTVDLDAMLGLVDAVRAADALDTVREEPLEVTFHRAIDVAVDPAELVEDVVQLGCTRVLTSGGASAAGEGTDVLATMVSRAAGRIEIMAGGGVVPEDVPALLATGVDAIHLSAKARGRAAASGPGGGHVARSVIDGELVAEMAALVHR